MPAGTSPAELSVAQALKELQISTAFLLLLQELKQRPEPSTAGHGPSELALLLAAAQAWNWESIPLMDAQ